MNSSTGPSAQQAFDGGDGFDARSDFDGALPDGSLPDAFPPPPPPPVDGGDAAVDAAPTTANVTVVGTNGLPKAGVAVVFQDATGAIVETKTTDALGRASRDVVAGSMVTVAAGGDGQRELFTFLGIKNGDEILALDVGPVAFNVGTFDVDLPASPPVGTLKYSAQAGDCQSNFVGQPPAQIFLLQKCQSGGKSPVVGFAYDEASNKSAWSSKKNNLLAADGGPASVTGLPAWSTTFGTLNVNLTNVPAAVPSITVVTAEVAAGVAQHSFGFANVTEGTASLQVQTLPGYADVIQPQAGALLGSPNISSWSILTKAITPPASGGAQAFDLAQLLPQLTDATADMTDAAHPKVLWTSAGPFTGADGGFARITWTGTTDAGATDADGWTFIFPASTTSVQGPQLPSSLAAWVPPTGTQVFAPVVALVDEDDIPSYESLLNKYPALTTTTVDGSNVVAPILPVNVTLRATYGYNPG